MCQNENENENENELAFFTVLSKYNGKLWKLFYTDIGPLPLS